MSGTFRPVIRGTLAGGAVLFIWGLFFWMVLPHEGAFRQFRDEDAVASILAQNATHSGIYVYPGGQDEEAMEKRARGPFAFVAFHPAGTTSMVRPLLTQLGIQILVAFIISILLTKLRECSYWERVGVVVTLFFLAFVLCDLPDWNWLHFSSAYILMVGADLLGGGFLAALAMVRIIR